MKNSDLGIKIKELRNRKGLSQDELATQAQLSLRTIQRMESSETAPRGDTLKRLANALQITPEELIGKYDAQPADRRFLALLNLSALGFFVFPLLGILIPLILWKLNKDSVKSIEENGKKLLNFQLSWCIVLLLFFIILIVFKVFHLPWPISFDSIYIISACYIINFVFIIFNSISALIRGESFYRPALRFIK